MLSLPVLLTTPISRLGLIVHFVDWAVFLLFHVLGRHLHVATGEDDVYLPVCPSLFVLPQTWPWVGLIHVLGPKFLYLEWVGLGLVEFGQIRFFAKEH